MILANISERNAIEVEPLSSLLEIHLVEKNDIFYKKGRVSAEEVYRRAWNTENLIDGNDYGVIITHQDQLVGNMNIQLRHENSHLKSEKFFGAEHWASYFDVAPTQTVEISGLSIPQNVNPEIRQSIMMLLIFGAYAITRNLGIRFWTTIQHKMLYRLLTKRLYLPLFTNEMITTPSENIPEDSYWNGPEPPRIYYLDLFRPKNDWDGQPNKPKNILCQNTISDRGLC